MENVSDINYSEMKHLELFFLGKHDQISVGKDIVRLLGKPKYVCIRVDKMYKSILLRPCESSDPMSFKVPDNLFDDASNVFRIRSKEFVEFILQVNGLEPKQSYSFKGKYLAEHNSVIVPMTLHTTIQS